MAPAALAIFRGDAPLDADQGWELTGQYYASMTVVQVRSHIEVGTTTPLLFHGHFLDFRDAIFPDACARR